MTKTKTPIAMEKWLREEVLPVCKKHDEDPSRAIPLEEVFADLWEHHEKCKQAQRRKESMRGAAEIATWGGGWRLSVGGKRGWRDKR